MCKHTGTDLRCGRVLCALGAFSPPKPGPMPSTQTDGGRPGLAPLAGYLGGVFMGFGSPNTPVDEGRTRRYNKTGLIENNTLFLPLANIPTVTNPTNYRMASPTGKVGGGLMFARLPTQGFASADARASLTLDPLKYPSDSRKISRAQIDAWGSTVGKISWTPGQMARETVIG